MKRRIFFSIAAVLILVSNIYAQDNKSNRFAVKSGHIEYNLTGNAEGTKSVWFDNYGHTFVEEKKTTTTVKMFGMKNVTEEHTLSIMQGPEIISIDFIKETAVKSVNPYYQDSRDFIEGMTEEEQEDFTNSVISSFGGEIIGEEDVLGKKCEIMAMLGSKAWIYKGITLKSESKVLGIKNIEEAVKFQENIKFPASKLKVPEGFEVEDLSQQMNEYSGEYDDEDEEEYEAHPVEMPYETFQKGIKNVSLDSYNRTTVMNMEGEQYMAVYMKSLTDAFTIVATSMEDADFDNSEDEDVLEKFKHDGRTMYYRETTDDGMTMRGITIEYKKFNTLITLVATSSINKEQLLDIYSDLNF